MRPYNRYLMALAAVLSLSTTVFAAYGVQQLDTYFSLYMIEYLVITMLFAYLHPRARRALDSISYLLFGGFLAIVAAKVVAILHLLGP